MTTPLQPSSVRQLEEIVAFNRELHVVGTFPMQVAWPLAEDLLAYIQRLESVLRCIAQGEVKETGEILSRKWMQDAAQKALTP